MAIGNKGLHLSLFFTNSTSNRTGLKTIPIDPVGSSFLAELEKHGINDTIFLARLELHERFWITLYIGERRDPSGFIT